MFYWEVVCPAAAGRGGADTVVPAKQEKTVIDIGRSSNGRTSDSGSEYRGSNPCLPANTGGHVTTRSSFTPSIPGY